MAQCGKDAEAPYELAPFMVLTNLSLTIYRQVRQRVVDNWSTKSEYRNKFKTPNQIENPKRSFGHWHFEVLDLFEISCLGFRIFFRLLNCITMENF
jgi:hypothetical protein